MTNEAREEIRRLHRLCRQLQDEIDLWRDRYEAERQAHEATIKHADKQLSELCD